MASDLISVFTREECQVGTHVFIAGINIGVTAADASRLYRAGRLSKSPELDALVKSEDDAAEAKRLREIKSLASADADRTANILTAEDARDKHGLERRLGLLRRPAPVETAQAVVEDRAEPLPSRRTRR